MTVRIFTGDCRDVLRTLEAGSIHSCICSPPYWGLRDYGIPPSIWGGDPKCEHVFGATERGKRKDMLPAGETTSKSRSDTTERQNGASHDGGNFCIHCNAWRGCYGLEPTYQLYIEHTVEIFDEVWRVLREDGTLWINLGDCYATRPCGWSAQKYWDEDCDDRTFRDKPFSTISPGFHADGSTRTTSRRGRSGNLGNGGLNGAAIPSGRVVGFKPDHAKTLRGEFTAGDRQRRLEGAGRVVAAGALKPKDLAGMPWRVAFALQDAGWYLRRDIIWHKMNPMPESVYDRPTTSHEYMFLFSKSGSTRCWRHEDGRWVYEKPAPDHRWRNRLTRELTEIPQKNKKKWFRVNLWRGFDYYYDFAAIMEPSSPDSHARAARSRSAEHKHSNGSDRSGKPHGIAIGSPVAGRYPQPAGWSEEDGHHGSVHPDGRRIGVGHNSRPVKGAPNGAGHRGRGRPDGEGMERWNAPGPNSRVKVDRVPVGRKLAPHDNPTGPRVKQNDSFDKALATADLVPMRNKRSVWSIATKPFKEAHFATFPPKLIEPCILAGCPKGGTVLDPFGGAGTTGLVAEQHGRNAILIELNAEYAAMAEARIAKLRMGPEEKKRSDTKTSGKLKPASGLPLFTKRKPVTRDRAQEPA